MSEPKGMIPVADVKPRRYIHRYTLSLTQKNIEPQLQARKAFRAIVRSDSHARKVSVMCLLHTAHIAAQHLIRWKRDHGA